MIHQVDFNSQGNYSKIIPLCLYGISIYLWSRGESNPRPNKAKAQFLHVYLVIDCRLKADHEQPTKQRSPVKFAPGVRPTVS